MRRLGKPQRVVSISRIEPHFIEMLSGRTPTADIQKVLVEPPGCPVGEASRTEKWHDLIVRRQVAANNSSLRHSLI
jgi:hypothetical protein